MSSIKLNRNTGWRKYAAEYRFLFDLPPHIPYNENDKDGKNASGIQTGSVLESDSRTVTFEIELKS